MSVKMEMQQMGIAARRAAEGLPVPEALAAEQVVVVVVHRVRGRLLPRA